MFHYLGPLVFLIVRLFTALGIEAQALCMLGRAVLLNYNPRAQDLSLFFCLKKNSGRGGSDLIFLFWNLKSYISFCLIYPLCYPGNRAIY